MCMASQSVVVARFFIATGWVLLSACVLTTASGPLHAAIGWLHGGCIALSDAGVAIGTGVALVSLHDPDQPVTRAHVQERVDGTDGCPALLPDRREANQISGLSFYRVEPAPEAELAIGVLYGHSGPAHAETALDTNADGRRDTFHQCTAVEGVQFSVWADEVGSGEPLWRGYYYLGYDVQPDCPDIP